MIVLTNLLLNGIVKLEMIQNLFSINNIFIMLKPPQLYLRSYECYQFSSIAGLYIYIYKKAVEQVCFLFFMGAVCVICAECSVGWKTYGAFLATLLAVLGIYSL